MEDLGIILLLSFKAPQKWYILEYQEFLYFIINNISIGIFLNSYGCLSFKSFTSSIQFCFENLLINDSVYSCLFFFLTGLHFFHLLVGLFLLNLLFCSCSFYILSLQWATINRILFLYLRFICLFQRKNFDGWTGAELELFFIYSSYFSFKTYFHRKDWARTLSTVSQSVTKKERKIWKTYEIIFCITNEISFTIISLSFSDKFFLEFWFSSWNYYYITNYHWNLLRFTLYIRS